LQARLPGLGAAGEDIENDFLAIDHRAAGELFPVSLL
jgi:hypothetical protein